jgi:hypothetical protein
MAASSILEFNKISEMISTAYERGGGFRKENRRDGMR